VTVGSLSLDEAERRPAPSPQRLVRPFLGGGFNGVGQSQSELLCEGQGEEFVAGPLPASGHLLQAFWGLSCNRLGDRGVYALLRYTGEAKWLVIG
jgi:hypothetical protein